MKLILFFVFSVTVLRIAAFSQMSEKCGRILHDPSTMRQLELKYQKPLPMTEKEIRQWRKDADDLDILFDPNTPPEVLPKLNNMPCSAASKGVCWKTYSDGKNLWVQKSTALPPLPYTKKDVEQCKKEQR